MADTMSTASIAVFFDLSKGRSIQTLIKPYHDTKGITAIIDSGVYNYLCDIYEKEHRFWYRITKGGETTHLVESEVPKELLASVLLMEN